MPKKLKQSMMIQRKDNLKSRNGCMECKRRKVKCDESPSGCAACFKRRSACSLTTLTPSTISSLSPSPVSTLLDLELLHNFSTKTCLSMTANVPLQHFYQTAFVTEALKSDYHLHCLLGLSAFHLVQQNHGLLEVVQEQEKPAIRAKIEECLLAAHFHHNAGVSSFRQSLMHITEENCHSLFACSSLIVTTSFAESCDSIRSVTNSRLPSGANQEPISTVTKWLILLRGAKAVAIEAWDWLQRGSMAEMLSPRGRRETYGTNIGVVDKDVTIYLNGLSAAFKERSEPGVRAICMEAVKLLHKSFAGIAAGCDFSVIFFWAVLVEADYMVLLEMKRPEALLVLAACCVLLYSQNFKWWMNGWPANMLRMIEGLIDEEWKEWLQWPCHATSNPDAGQRTDQVLVVTEGVCCQ